jgi:DNA-binding MarR family transcriptional regulator
MTIQVKDKVVDEHPDETARWTILSNHGHALVYLAIRPDIRLWELAAQLGIRERSAHRIVSELATAGYVNRQHHGRRVIYTVDRSRGLRRADLSHTRVGDLIDLIFKHMRASDEGDGSNQT